MAVARKSALRPMALTRDGLVPKGTVRIATIMAIPQLLTELGIDPAPLLGGFRLDPEYFVQPDNTIAVGDRLKLLDRCAEATSCPHFGLLVGQRAGIASLGILAFLMQSSPDVRTALRLMSHHFSLQNPTVTVEIDESGRFTTFSYTTLRPSSEDNAQLLDGAAAAMFNVMRALCGHQWSLTELRLARARPRDVAPYKTFFKAPLVFDATETALVFHRHWLDRPLPGADPLLHMMIQQRVHDLELLSSEGLVDQTRRLLLSLVTKHAASSAVAARHLGLSTRTLARRLAAEGTTFAELRDEARYSIARQLLEFTSMPSSEVASRIGYANASAFTTAFRRWSGTGPTRWRAAKKKRASRRVAPKR